MSFLSRLSRSLSTVSQLQSKQQFRVALEWTPNTNHIGFFVARAKGYYNEHNLEIELISPDIDGYKMTPGRRAISGGADFAMGPTETAISSATTDPDKTRLLSMAALLQKSTSAVVSLKSSGITNINDMRRYASYEGRFEMAIIRQMIANNGGDPTKLEEVKPSKLDIWPSMMSNLKEADSTWVFVQWEGVEAAINGVELNVFKLEDYHIPYGYSPILLGREDVLKSQPDEVRNFLAATKRGYEFAAKLENVDECTDILIEDSGNHSSIKDKKELVRQSMQYLVERECFVDEKGQWGRMDVKVWDDFLDFVVGKGLITKRDGSVVQRNEIRVEDLIWNQL